MDVLLIFEYQSYHKKCKSQQSLHCREKNSVYFLSQLVKYSPISVIVSNIYKIIFLAFNLLDKHCLNGPILFTYHKKCKSQQSLHCREKNSVYFLSQLVKYSPISVIVSNIYKIIFLAFNLLDKHCLNGPILCNFG